MKTILLFTLTAHIVLAGPNNSANPTSIDPISLKVTAAEACVEKIQSLIAKLSTLHESLTNQAPRSECVMQRLSKSKAVYELVKSVPAEIAALTGDDAEDLAEEQLHRAALALTRIEMLVQETKECLNLPLPPVKQPRAKPTITDPQLLAPVRPAGETPPIPATRASRPFVARKPGDAISQGDFAKLLAPVCGLGSPDTGAAAIAVFNQREIAPSTGWQAERPLSLDVFSVVMVQLLRIPIEPGAEPRLQYQALRQQGFPLDQSFPGYSGKGEAPLLAEGEVRRFLAIGLAEGITHPGHPD